MGCGASTVQKKGAGVTVPEVIAPAGGKKEEKHEKHETHSEHTPAPQSAEEILKMTPGMFVGGKEGRISDTYSLGKKLGDGAFGCVRVAKHKLTGIIRAVKTIDKTSVEQSNDRDRLLSEVAVLKMLDHPNIMKLYEFYEDSKHYHLVMELYTGGELFDKVLELSHFSESLAADVMKQVLSGVTYCHKHQIVHRDLKPENLLLESKEKNAQIKIIDFGTSKVFAGEGGKKMNQKLGTPYYVAPEVLKRKYDEKCDVWSCGVILYILLVGYPPFAGTYMCILYIYRCVYIMYINI
jgi:calcium-dependent protein kinase